ncbi:hypothetical protein R50912_10275 [Paenibacillus sp. FSL R5-0912]|nr:hypothetical protein R50912_10275 [Paenibacillus sp. FSL R5-0912]
MFWIIAWNKLRFNTFVQTFAQMPLGRKPISKAWKMRLSGNKIAQFAKIQQKMRILNFYQMINRDI